MTVAAHADAEGRGGRSQPLSSGWTLQPWPPRCASPACCLAHLLDLRYGDALRGVGHKYAGDEVQALAGQVQVGGEGVLDGHDALREGGAGRGT